MRNQRLWVALLLFSTVVVGQSKHTFSARADHPLGISQPRDVLARSLQDTLLRVLCLMVDFQTDTDPQTSGDGKFQQSGSSSLIDPPPHDQTYFSYKLEFVKNYFRKVSNGKLTITGTVLNQVVTLPNLMSAYAPTATGGTNKSLVQLIMQSWHAADSISPSLDFTQYNAFVIFHAGVGRDIDMVNLLGYDPTPYDLPSLFINLQGMRDALGDQTYAGVSVNGGAFRITNTMILPETETRPIQTSLGSDTLKIGMNGLFAASVGSRLGLPDLFDTKTGRQGIGQFGLMDGAAIFAYNGLFPPEPSAWEKIYLGWVTPITINSTQTVSLPAVGLTTVGQDTIYKIPISDTEYFLMENRNRDPQMNGQLLTIYNNGKVSLLRIPSDSTNFFTFDNAVAIGGSVFDVEDFDWALIGRMNTGGLYDGGGVLIWHIDESVINANLATNTVNANSDHRGVNLEEADGAQDIGQVYDLLDPGYGSSSGSPLDCWFKDNSAAVYRNTFDKSSFPNSRSYSGAASLVTIKDFSARSARMTATVQLGDDRFLNIPAFARSLGNQGGVTYPTASSSGVFVSTANRVYAFQPNGQSKTQDPTGLFSSGGGQFKVVVVEPGVLVGAQDSSLYIWKVNDVNNDGVYDSVSVLVVPLGRRVTTPPSYVDLFPSQDRIVIGGESGSLWRANLSGSIQLVQTGSANPVTSITQLPSSSGTVRTNYFFACGGRLYGQGVSVDLGDSSLPWILASGSGENFVAAAQLGGNRVTAWDVNLTTKKFDFTSGATISAIAISDVDGDGHKDIVILAEGNLIALNIRGSLLDGFPVRLAQGIQFVGTPLFCDLDGDGIYEIMVATSTGAVQAYKSNGSPFDGFPLQISSPGMTYPVLFQSSSGQVGVLGVSSTSSVEARAIVNASLSPWTQYLSDGENRNADLSSPAIRPISSDFFPKSRAYNWPNPVYGTTTQIRYFVSQPADVTVKIFDLAGSKITELKGKGIGGLDNELTWDVTNIQSGVYLARIEATWSGGNDATIIKIAVVK